MGSPEVGIRACANRLCRGPHRDPHAFLYLTWKRIVNEIVVLDITCHGKYMPVPPGVRPCKHMSTQQMAKIQGTGQTLARENGEAYPRSTTRKRSVAVTTVYHVGRWRRGQVSPSVSKCLLAMAASWGQTATPDSRGAVKLKAVNCEWNEIMCWLKKRPCPRHPRLQGS